MVADRFLHHHLRHLCDVQLFDEQVLFVQKREEGFVGLSQYGSRIIAIHIMRLPWYDSPTNLSLIILSNLAPIKRLGKQFLVVFSQHPVFKFRKFRVIGQKLDGGLTDLGD